MQLINLLGVKGWFPQAKGGVAFAFQQVLGAGGEQEHPPPKGCGMGLLRGQGSRDLLCSRL